MIDDVKLLMENGWRVIRTGPLMLDHQGGFTGESDIWEPRESIAMTAKWLTKTRDECGSNFVLGIDYHHRLSIPATASFCQRMPSGTLDFIEEPIRDESPEAYEALRKLTDVPFAVGEEFSSKWQFMPYIEKHLTDFARVDICNVGGFTEAMKVAGWAEAHNIDLMPHNPLGFCKGFDRIILRDIKENEIVTARRYQLDPVKWEVIPEYEHIDYEKLIVARSPRKFTGSNWPQRSEERADIQVDETMAMQGSMWVMPKSWWTTVVGRLQTDGYGPYYQDSIEMLFRTWQAGGKLMLNKNAWYAHRHKSFPRTHHYPGEKARMEWAYALVKHYPEYVEMRKRWTM